MNAYLSHWTRLLPSSLPASADSESSSSSSDDSDFDESDEASEEDENVYDLDTCPVGCPLEEYEYTCAVRERRLDVEDEMIEEKKALEQLRKELEAINKKHKVVESALKQAQTELEAFQVCLCKRFKCGN